MRTAHALRTAITVGATLALATGCGVEFGEPADSTSTTPTLAMDNLLNPCTDIPDEWLIETGVDPDSKRDIVNPTDASAWRICGWTSLELPYTVDLLSTSRTIEDARANVNLDILRDVAIGTRNGIVARDKSDTNELSCYVALPAEQGMFEIAVGWFASEPITRDRCELAIEHATDLEKNLPR